MSSYNSLSFLRSVKIRSSLFSVPMRYWLVLSILALLGVQAALADGEPRQKKKIKISNGDSAFVLQQAGTRLRKAAKPRLQKKPAVLRKKPRKIKEEELLALENDRNFPMFSGYNPPPDWNRERNGHGLYTTLFKQPLPPGLEPSAAGYSEAKSSIPEIAAYIYLVNSCNSESANDSSALHAVLALETK